MRIALAGLLISIAIVAVFWGRPKPAGGMVTPEYNTKGELARPADFAQWTFLGASVGLSYSEGARNEGGPGTFHNVQIQPEAYRVYKETGKFPEKTILVLTLYEPEQKVSPAKHGYFEGKLVAQEVAVKDKERFPGGWAYFDFKGGANILAYAAAQPKEGCFACHAKNAQDDNVFVQFYPALRK
ncbi:MAG TPA: cytochrome P460 family protein [Bryobacteraceae bacterium]|nr:cytochrome P460 family protein [Bryobacteraceae bacterium]